MVIRPSLRSRLRISQNSRRESGLTPEGGLVQEQQPGECESAQGQAQLLAHSSREIVGQPVLEKGVRLEKPNSSGMAAFAGAARDTW